jgi:hypothetical protein
METDALLDLRRGSKGVKTYIKDGCINAADLQQLGLRSYDPGASFFVCLINCIGSSTGRGSDVSAAGAGGLGLVV